MQTNISKVIKKIRLDQNMSQERFGSKIKVSGKMISCYERGTCTPPLKVLDEISRVYNVPILFSKKDSKDDLMEKVKQIRKILEDLGLSLENNVG
jgi:transcriptional regulator with XRE-family HTH domain